MTENFLPIVVRDSAILTNSYVAGTIIKGAESFNQLDIQLKFTKGSLTTGELKVEFSTDSGVSYTQDTNSSISTGTTTLSLNEYQVGATGNYRISVPITASWIKISVKGTGTATDSLAAVVAILNRS